MNNKKDEAAQGMRPIEERVDGPLDKGHAMDAHLKIAEIIKRHTFATVEELENQIVEEVLIPMRDLTKGYKSLDNDMVLLIIFVDDTGLQMNYTEVDGKEAIDVRSGWDVLQKRHLN